jgi:hypothetical protein
VAVGVAVGVGVGLGVGKGPLLSAATIGALTTCGPVCAMAPLRPPATAMSAIAVRKALRRVKRAARFIFVIFVADIVFLWEACQ